MMRRIFQPLIRVLARVGRPLASLARTYPLLFVAVGFAIGILISSWAISNHLQAQASKAFRPEKVLPNPVSQPSAAPVSFTTEQLKQYDGQNGHACYVAVKGTVYEINNQYWQDGKHIPSGKQAYCGADMTEVIGKSPHGESVLSQLPKVGAFKP